MTQKPIIRALCVVYGGGHATIAVELAAVAAEMGIDLQILALSTGGAKLRRHGIACLGFRDLILPRVDAAALAEGRRLSARMHHGGLGITQEESEAYLGLSMTEFRERVGPEADELFQRFGRSVWLPVGALERALDRVTPDVVLVTNAPRAERAALLAAERRRIPTVRIEDLFGRAGIIRPITEALGDRRAEAVVGTVRPTMVSVMNTQARDNVLAFCGEELLSVADSSVQILGQPALERATRKGGTPDSASRMALRHRLGLPDTGPLVLWATDNLPPDLVLMPALANWSITHPDAHLCVKLHPGPTTEYLRFFQSFAGPRITIFTDSDIHQLIRAADATIAHFSTVAIEVALLRGCLVQVDLHRSADRADPYAGLRHAYESTIPYFRGLAQVVIDDVSTVAPRLIQALSLTGTGLVPDALHIPMDGARRILAAARRLVSGGDLT